MTSFALPDWDEISRSNFRDIMPSPVTFAPHIEREDSSHHSKQSERQQSRDSHSKTMDRPSSNMSPPVYTTLSAERDIIMQKDLQLGECTRILSEFSNAVSKLANVVINVNEAFENQGGIENKELLKLLQPIQHFQREFNVVSEVCPREAVVFQSEIQKLIRETRGALLMISQCEADRSRLYKEQLKKMREVSNISTRNALQAERGEHSMTLLKMKTAHEEEMSRVRDEHRRGSVDSENKIAILNDKLDKLRKTNKDLENAQEEASVTKIRERIDRAVQHALSDQKMAHKEQLEELDTKWRGRVRDMELLWEKKLKDVEEVHQERMEMQNQHHEKMAEILLQEKEKIEHECVRLTQSMQQQAEALAAEKEKLKAERDEEFRQKELENDLRNAEHIKTVSAVKAELSAKVRQVKEEERMRSEDVEVAFNREKEQIESNHAAEVDRLLGQHRRAVQQLRAQLEVKFDEEMISVKRRQENEVKRYAAEIDRLRRLVARRGTGGGQDGISLVTYDDEEDVEREYDKSHSSTAGRRTQHSTSASPMNLSRNSSLFSRRRQSPPRSEDRSARPDFSKTIRTPSDFSNTVRLTHGEDITSPRSSGDNLSRSVQFKSNASSLDLTPKKGALSSSAAPSSTGGKSKLRWGALEESLAQQDALLMGMNLDSPTTAQSPGREEKGNLHESELSSASTSPPPGLPSPAVSKTPSSLGYSPSPTIKFTGGIRSESPAADDAEEIEPPPPPPPDPFSLDVALEESKVEGHNVGSNAANVGKYMKQLERYLQGHETKSDSMFSSTGDADEEGENFEENSSFPLDYLDVVGTSDWREVEQSFDLSADFENDSLSE